MKKWYKVTIPKPCREDWNKMTSNKKGKFCDVCTKTVIDFTNKSTNEIQDILLKNHDKRVCGHFYKSQLATINIEIPNFIFKKQYSQVRIFALALLVTMGTSLMSCQTDGKVKKIESVDIVDSIPKTKKIKKDSILIDKPVIPKKPQNINLKGIIIQPVMGDIIIEQEKNTALSFNLVEMIPQFKKAKDNSKKSFNKQMAQFVQDNFNLDISPDYNLPKGKKRISVQFTIDKTGNVKDIKVRAPNKTLEKTTIEMFKKLPQFIPAKHKGRTVAIKYNLPIYFNVE